VLFIAEQHECAIVDDKAQAACMSRQHLQVRGAQGCIAQPLADLAAGQGRRGGGVDQVEASSHALLKRFWEESLAAPT
jgi:hypothetical protein